MKTRCLVLATFAVILAVTACAPVFGIPITFDDTFTTSLAIPDNDPTGVSDTRTLTFPGVTSITSVQVSLQIDGGYNGDFYAYLRHGTTGFAVLLNRVGVTAVNSDGYPDAGFDVTFEDTAANGDIHLYQSVHDPGGAALIGTWQPDGRNVDPSLVTDLSSRTAFLSSFASLNPNGDWTLFVADLSPLSTGTLKGWGLSVTANAAPTPDGAPGLLGLLVLASAPVFHGIQRLRRYKFSPLCCTRSRDHHKRAASTI